MAIGNIEGTTPESAALVLFYEVAKAEKKDTWGGPGGDSVNRKWLLDTYAECLNAVKVPASRSPVPK